MPWVEKERAALVATLRGADADAPTLCEGWDVRRLLAHLVLREQQFLASVSDGLSRPKPGQEKNLTRLTDQAQSTEGFHALIDRFSAGAPGWSPMSWAGERINLVEYVIHHEDIRRAGPTPAEPRSLPESELASIFGRISLMARVAFVRSPVGVGLARPGKPAQLVKKGPTPVEISGDPVDLALYIGGRRSAAQVEVAGPPEAVASFQAWVARS